MEHRLPGEKPADRQAVETPDQPLFLPDFDGMGPAEAMEVTVGAQDRRRDPSPGADGVGAAEHDLLEGAVGGDPETTHRATQGPTHVEIGRADDAARVR